MRGTGVEVDSRLHPAPAPRFSRTPGAISRPAPEPGADTDQVLADWGITGLDRLRKEGAIG
jgi:alpha-methylacyl-CoA racemase